MVGPGCRNPVLPVTRLFADRLPIYLPIVPDIAYTANIDDPALSNQVSDVVRMQTLRFTPALLVGKLKSRGPNEDT